VAGSRVFCGQSVLNETGFYDDLVYVAGSVAGRAAVHRNLQSHAAVELAAKVVQAYRGSPSNSVSSAAGNSAGYAATVAMDVYVDLIQFGMRFKIPMQQPQIRGGSDAVWLARGPRWAQAWASHRPMMGPRLGPPWAQDGTKLGSPMGP
jgi:hypothetical protein